MENRRSYGGAPFRVAVLHGGPGAPGTMAPVARELSRAGRWGILEPLQTADSLEGQIEELRAVLTEHADPPVTLIGSSWGAMLGYLYAARYPESVQKLILVGSGVYDERYAAAIQATRLSRLAEGERREVQSLMKALDDPTDGDNDTSLARLGELLDRTEHFDPITLDTEVLDVQGDVFQRVWGEARELRRSGKLLEIGRRIACPVVALHGDYDPHPAEGVENPLRTVLKDFRFHLLKDCGHLPWIESHARDAFYEILRQELPERSDQ